MKIFSLGFLFATLAIALVCVADESNAQNAASDVTRRTISGSGIKDKDGKFKIDERIKGFAPRDPNETSEQRRERMRAEFDEIKKERMGRSVHGDTLDDPEERLKKLRNSARGDDDGVFQRPDGPQGQRNSPYRRMFQAKRVEQFDSIRKINSYDEKQKKVVLSTLLETIIATLSKHRPIVESIDIDWEVLPTDIEKLDAISGVLENSAYLGDLFLRFSDIVKPLVVDNQEYLEIIKWAAQFTEKSTLLTQSEHHLMKSILHELGIIDDSRYINPFKRSDRDGKDGLDEESLNDPNRRSRSPRRDTSAERQIRDEERAKRRRRHMEKHADL